MEPSDMTYGQLEAEVRRLRYELELAREAFDSVKGESANLLEKYSSPATSSSARCASCIQHETVIRKDTEARALATTARRYKRERDDALTVIEKSISEHPTAPDLESEDSNDLEVKIVDWELRFEDSETRRHQATAQAARLLGQTHAAMHVIADELGIEIDNYNDEDLINMVFLLIRKDRLV